MNITLPQRIFSNELLLAALVILPPVWMGGCAAPKNPDGRENVTGTITINGAPLTGTAATIIFSPVSGADESGGLGQINKGSYSLTGPNAVKPGKYIVRITAWVDFDKTTGTQADNTLVFGNEVPVDVVPPEFNKDSKIEFEVVAGKNNVFNYDIKTDYIPQMPKNPKTKTPIPL